MRLAESYRFLPATAILRGCSTRLRALPDPGSLTEVNWIAPSVWHDSKLEGDGEAWM